MLGLLSYFISRETCNEVVKANYHSRTAQESATTAAYKTFGAAKDTTKMASALPLAYYTYKGFCGTVIGNLPIISAASTIAKYTVSPIASTVVSGVASVLGCAAKGLVFYPVSAFALIMGLTFYKTGDIQRFQPVIEKTGSALHHTGNAGIEAGTSAYHGAKAIGGAVSDLLSGKETLAAEMARELKFAEHEKDMAYAYDMLSTDFVMVNDNPYEGISSLLGEESHLLAITE
ncbi:MAG: hypothetical protein MRQ07_00500 [Candidatus Midichloria sp.]|nr:hypothetical protein [Candidatus Midichloria sp.]